MGRKAMAHWTGPPPGEKDCFPAHRACHGNLRPGHSEHGIHKEKFRSCVEAKRACNERNDSC